MRILLVRPPRIKQAVTVGEMMFSEPLGLEMLNGVLRSDHQVKIFDMMIDEDLRSELESYRPQAVGFTSLCVDVGKVLQLSRLVKELDPSITTIVGGTQCLLRPESFFDETMDHIFKFTTENNLKRFFNMLEGGISDLIPGILSRELSYKDEGTRGRNQYLLPDRTSTKKYRGSYSYFGYMPAAIMEYGTGCGKACSFCLRWGIEGVEEKLIDPDLTRRDLLSIEEDTIMFIDNDFFSSADKVSGFLGLVKELGLKKNYIVYGSVEGILSCRKLLSEFVDAGLRAVLVGYETFSDAELMDYRKRATAADSKEVSRLLKAYRVDVWASFMAHPDWEKDDFKALRRFIGFLSPEISTINPLTPFPGLPIHKEFRDRLLFSEDDHERWSFGQVVVKPSRMGLRSYYWELMKTYLYINLMSNKSTEMLKKYGFKSLLRIGKGSVRLSWKYLGLIIKG